MEKRKDIFGAFLASSVNTLEDLLSSGQSNSLTAEDIPSVMSDAFTLARIYLALYHDDLSYLDEESLNFMDSIEAFVFKHGDANFVNKITS